MTKETEKFLELNSSRSLPVIKETMDCGDGRCGCGCGDFVTLKSPKQKGLEEE